MVALSPSQPSSHPGLRAFCAASLFPPDECSLLLSLTCVPPPPHPPSPRSHGNVVTFSSWCFRLTSNQLGMEGIAKLADVLPLTKLTSLECAWPGPSPPHLHSHPPLPLHPIPISPPTPINPSPSQTLSLFSSATPSSPRCAALTARPCLLLPSVGSSLSMRLIYRRASWASTRPC